MQSPIGSYVKQMNSKRMLLRQSQKVEYELSIREFKESVLIVLDFLMA